MKKAALLLISGLLIVVSPSIATVDSEKVERSTQSNAEKLKPEVLRSHVKNLLLILWSHYSEGRWLQYPDRQDSQHGESDIDLLRAQIKRLKAIIKTQEVEIKRLRELCQKAGVDSKAPEDIEKQEQDPESVGQVKVTQRPVFGIFLGEKISEVQQRFRLSKLSKRNLMGQEFPYYEHWIVHQYSDVIDKCTLQTFLGRVVLISVFFKDGTERNFSVLKKQIEETYQVQGRKIFRELGWECSVEIDEIPVFIHVYPEPKFPSLSKIWLSVTYIHQPLMEKSCSLADRHRAKMVGNEL